PQVPEARPAGVRGRDCAGRSTRRDRGRGAGPRAGSRRVHPGRAARDDRRLRVRSFLRQHVHQPRHGLCQDRGASAWHALGKERSRRSLVTANDDEDTLLQSVALQNATSILIARQRAEQRSEFYLAEGQRLSRTGSFGWRPSTGELFWSEETFRIFQYDPATKPTVERVLQRVHPEDAALVQEAIESAAQKGRDFDFEHRLLMPDRSVRHLHVVARASRDEAGGLEFAGAVMDVTE